MRTPFLAGNWKMFKTVSEAVAFAEAVKGPLSMLKGVECGICASAVLLHPLSLALKGSSIHLGAQNMYWEKEGAFTGETSPVMLGGIADCVIIGHSERRQYFGETDETVNRKLKAALAHSLMPIVCVGESLAQNQAGETEAFVSGQIKGAFADISAEQAAGIVVAYEPIWAIGTGLAATSEDANRIIGQVVRATLAGLYGKDVAGQIRIQYGGSVNTGNVAELMSQPEIDGGLVGGASLKPEGFIALCEATAQAKSKG
ncbi:MAG: triose-phosphate isomerase [Anaerolineae bacterium]|nr:triose-phosphate isomerase [Anaerolineae bacterium]